MYCTDPHKMNYEVLSNRTKYFKESEEGVRTMCELMEEYSRERVESAEAKGRKEGLQVGREEGLQVGREEGLQVGREESAREFVNSLWADGIRDMERISKLTKLSIEEVKKLIEGKSA